MNCHHCGDYIPFERSHKKNVKYCDQRCYKDAQLERSKKQYQNLINKPPYKDRNEEIAAAFCLLREHLKPVSKSKLVALGFTFPPKKDGLNYIQVGDYFASTSNWRNITFFKHPSKSRKT